MKNEEARFILQAFRPGGADRSDPFFAEALAQADRDPQLGAWFAREQAFDAAIAANLRDISPPAELRDNIMAGGRAGMWHRSTWRLPVWLGAAAAVAALFFTVVRLRPAAPVDARQLTSFALIDASHEELHKGMVAGLAGVEDTLADPKTHLAPGLNVNEDDLRARGCRTVQVAGRDVFEICFKRGDEFHLYIARTGEFKTQLGPGKPAFQSQGGMSSVTWTAGNHVYVLVSDRSMEELTRLL
jgi:hypothetical protein